MKKELLDKIYQDMNIYALINRLKKELGWSKDMTFPDEVMISVCEAFLLNRGAIRNPWRWFLRVMAAESGKYFAKKQIEEGNQWKKERMPESIKQLLKNL